MPELWTPGAAQPSNEDFVDRIHGQIRRFAAANGVAEPVVEVELADGAVFAIESISPEPGYGFVTITPDPTGGGDPEPEQLIVPIRSLARIVLSAAHERRGRLGFSLPTREG